MTASRLLRFDTRADGEAFLAALGMAETDPATGAAVLPQPGRLDGVRFDLLPVGGDGVLRRLHVTPEGDVTVETVPGWHVDLLWHGKPEALPDFGTAVAAEVSSVAWTV